LKGRGKRRGGKGMILYVYIFSNYLLYFFIFKLTIINKNYVSKIIRIFNGSTLIMNEEKKREKKSFF
jgi:hypothetical protein